MTFFVAASNRGPANAKGPGGQRMATKAASRAPKARMAVLSSRDVRDCKDALRHNAVSSTKASGHSCIAQSNSLIRAASAKTLRGCCCDRVALSDESESVPPRNKRRIRSARRLSSAALRGGGSDAVLVARLSVCILTKDSARSLTRVSLSVVAMRSKGKDAEYVKREECRSRRTSSLSLPKVAWGLPLVEAHKEGWEARRCRASWDRPWMGPANGAPGTGLTRREALGTSRMSKKSSRTKARSRADGGGPAGGRGG